MVGDVDAIFEIVRHAWTQTLPRTAFDPDMTWEDAGADSLKSLQFLMRLETALKRQISFDQLSSDMTARMLSAVLAGEGASPATALPTPHAYLVPGLYGDAPGLAKFRADMTDTLRLELIDIPALDTPTRIHRDIASTARAIANKIPRQEDEQKPVAIVGFSFGGIVAQEIAAQREANGTPIALLILIDPHLAPGKANVASAALRQEADPRLGAVRDARGNAVSKSTPSRKAAFPLRINRLKLGENETLEAFSHRAIFSVLLRVGLVEVARRFIKDKPAAPLQAIWRRKAILGLSRSKAMKIWQPRSIQTPTILFTSVEGEQVGLQHQWSEACRNIEIYNLPFKHFDLLRSESTSAIKSYLASNSQRFKDNYQTRDLDK